MKKLAIFTALLCFLNNITFAQTTTRSGNEVKSSGIKKNLISSANTAYFYEDFDGIPGPTAGGSGTYAFPTGWLLRNVDNRTPNAQVAYVNEAWERREDFSISNNNTADSAAFSTSFYSPEGQADDWMWTPQIAIPANAVLKWNAVTYDPEYLDGYEVRIMTTAPTGGNGDIGNQVSASTQIFSIPAENTVWTARTVSLTAYAGQNVYIGFRNNSNDKFLLLIDDVLVEGTPLPPTVVIAKNPDTCTETNVRLSANCPFGTPIWYDGESSTAVVGTGSPIYITPNVVFTFYASCKVNSEESARVQTNSLSVANLERELLGTSPFQDSLWTFSLNTWTVRSRVMPTLVGSTITGINSISQNPANGLYYCILKVSGGRVFASINPTTGVCTQIGGILPNFSSITFTPSGKCYGMTGTGATPSKTLFTINVSTGATTLLSTIGFGSDGQVIAFNKNDGFIYHWASGTPNMGKIDTTAFVRTAIILSGAPGNEIFGAVYNNDGTFITSNIASNFKVFKANGYVSNTFGNAPDDIRGLAFFNPNLPHANSLDITTNYSSGYAIKIANQTITASNKIMSPANVLYRAGNSISLDVGFEVGAASIFKAEIGGGCN